MPTFPSQPLNIRIRIAPGADLTQNPSTYTWTDVTTDVDFTYEITSEVGADDDASEENTQLTWTMRNTSGKYTTDNPESTLYPLFDIGCPVEYALDSGDGAGYRVRVIAYLSDAEDELTANTPYRCVTHCIALGKFDALSRPGNVLKSALTRTALSRKRKGVWPLEDERGSTVAASLIAGNPPMAPTWPGAVAPEFGAEAPVAGTISGVLMKTGSQLYAKLGTPTVATSFRASVLMYAPTPPPGPVGTIFLEAIGSNVFRYALQIGPNYLRHQSYDTNYLEVSGAGTIGFGAHQTAMVWLEWELAQSGANVTWLIRETTWTIGADGAAVGASGQASGSYAGTLGQVSGVGLGLYTDLDNVTFSQFWLTEGPFPAGGGFAAVQGWAGETAAARVQGMSNEFGLPSTVTSTALGERMGPQLTDSLLDNLRDVKATDHGVLSDRLGTIAYRAMSELYNLTPAITLSRTVRGELGVMVPQRSSQWKVNSATVSRRGGTSWTIADAADIARFGQYESPSTEINPSADAALPGHAGYRLARGLSPRKRYERLTIDLMRAPQHATAVLALLPGDRIAASSLPPQQAKGGQEWQVRGWTERVAGADSPRYSWKVDYRLVPVDPYNVFQWDIDRWESPGTEIVQAQTSTGTGLLVQTADAPITVTGSTSIGLNVMGEQVTMTAVANETTADPFTRTVSGSWGSFPATTHLAAAAWVNLVSTAPGTAADFNTGGATATHTLQAAGSRLRSEIPHIMLTNPDTKVTINFSVVPTGASIHASIFYRILTSAGSSYIATINIVPGGDNRLFFFTPSNTLIADVPLGITHAAGLDYTIRIAPIGTRHRVKVWTGATEPDGWLIDLVDTERIKPGMVALRSGRSVGNTNAGTVTATWDNVTFSGVQYITTTRSVNGVVKAQPAGGSVKLWRSRGYGI